MVSIKITLPAPLKQMVSLQLLAKNQSSLFFFLLTLEKNTVLVLPVRNNARDKFMKRWTEVEQRGFGT